MGGVLGTGKVGAEDALARPGGAWVGAGKQRAAWTSPGPYTSHFDVDEEDGRFAPDGGEPAAAVWAVGALPEENAPRPVTLGEAQVAEFCSAFRLLDADGDGTITRDELARVFANLGHTASESEIDEYMARATGSRAADTISLGEFIATMERVANAARGDDDEIRRAFEVFDCNGNGYIDAGELRRVMTAFGEALTEEEVNDMMAEADTNGDGRIDYDEFKAMMMPPPPPSP